MLLIININLLPSRFYVKIIICMTSIINIVLSYAMIYILSHVYRDLGCRVDFLLKCSLKIRLLQYLHLFIINQESK